MQSFPFPPLPWRRPPVMRWPKPEQPYALQSEVNAAKHATEKVKADFSEHEKNGTIHVTAENKAAWNGKYSKPAAGIPKTDLSSDIRASLGKADTAIQQHQDISKKADLVDGKVPSSQLPSYVDDVLEYASRSAFPATGESGKIYVALDTNKTYRWSGSEYVQVGGGDVPSPSDATPQMDGAGAAGTATTYARGDHQHPSDTTRVPRTGDTGLTGNFKTTGMVHANAFTADDGISAGDLAAQPPGAYVVLTKEGILISYDGTSMTRIAIPGGEQASDPTNIYPVLATTNQIPSLTNYVQKSQTAGLLKNDGSVDTNTYLAANQRNLLPYATSSGCVTLALGTASYRASLAADGTFPTITDSGIPSGTAYYQFELELAVPSTVPATIYGPTMGGTAFDSTASYAVGDYVVYDNVEYVCVTAHTGAWDASHFKQAWVFISGYELPDPADLSGGETICISVRLDCTARTFLASVWRVA